MIAAMECPGSGQPAERDSEGRVECSHCGRELRPKFNRVGFLRPHKRQPIAQSSDRELGIIVARNTCKEIAANCRTHCYQSIRSDAECCHWCRAYRELERRVGARARALARGFGADCHASPGGSFEEYRDHVAHAYGYNSWGALPGSLKSEALREFAAGKADETKAGGDQ